jgi:hypothetical protein
MQFLSRRLSPSFVIAIAALFVALAGTAAAAVIVDSPDDMADGVVTESKLAPESVSRAKIKPRAVAQANEANPTLRFSLAANGTLLTGDTVTPSHTAGSNRYDISFTKSDLGSAGLDSCGFAVSPRFDLTTSPGHNGHLNMRAYVNHARGSGSFQVFTFEQLPEGAEVPREAAFDVVAGC